VRTRFAFAVMLSCCAALAIACAPAGEKTDETAGGTTATPSGGPTILTLADVAGKWTMTAVPAGGTDTTPTVSVLVATADTVGWTSTFPNRPALPVRVTLAGDSIITVTGPYESVRRPGVQVTTTSVSRLQDGKLVGTSIARYKTTGADSVVVFRVTGTKAPK
jgi:hypothetical protein